MGTFKGVAAGLAAVSLLASVPASAGVSDNAETLRRLDIMLMVTALRCRFGEDNFQAEYDAFATRHHAELNDAARALTTELARRNGTKGAQRALDKMSTEIANGYGMGHPDLECVDLKRTTQELTDETDPEALVAAADRLINIPQQSMFALAQR